MKISKKLLLGPLLGSALVWAGAAHAHCDTLDGPVVNDARTALSRNDVTPVLKWVKQADEQEVREAFARAAAVRKQGKDAQELADRYFFETLVRVHRAGEGAPYTGLQPAGSVEPAIAAADQALETGKIDALADEVAQAVREGIRHRFTATREKKQHAQESVEAGRAFVASYVDYVHFVEAMHQRAASADTGHSHTKPAHHRH